MDLQNKITEELEAWLPRLIQLWRGQAKSQWDASLTDKLLPPEAKSVASGIHRLSVGLTRERELAGEQYFTDPVQFGAYLLYFWPVSYAQARLVLAQLTDRPQSLLEVGSGAAPLSAAAFQMGIRDITLADRSRKALTAGLELLQSAGAAPRSLLWDLNRPWDQPDQRFDLIAFQHVINELWPEDKTGHAQRLRLLQDLTQRLTPSGRLLLIEPALKTTSQMVLRLRDDLCRWGLSLEFPCLHNAPCPALAQDNSCHSESDWTPPELVQSLIQRAGLHKPELKMTVLLFSRKGVRSAKPGVLVTSAVKRAKNRSLFVTVCGGFGSKELTLPAGVVLEDARSFSRLQPGDRVQCTETIENKNAILLTAKSRIRSQPPSDSQLQVRC